MGKGEREMGSASAKATADKSGNGEPFKPLKPFKLFKPLKRLNPLCHALVHKNVDAPNKKYLEFYMSARGISLV